MTIRTSARPDLDVRPFQSRDLDDVIAIEQESFSEPWTWRMFEAELQGNPFGRFLGAFLSGEGSSTKPLLGYICYWVVFEELRLMNLAVRQDCRRLGIASHLVRHAIEEGITQGTTRALLEVRAGNRVGQQLYQSLGFRQYGCRRSYYTNPNEDAILMQLPLTNNIHL
ncbi:MAG: ribosomal protein S18-alanine N-acetyltransferase [Nitrospira sp.]|nr:ribosomal protein S18-alanine N-acetyltransferase [Nitrospira sp.]MDE0404153.1 ribosomal protein S18-alanine N-acetyltransferase [Nitrospira sp.]MDE0487361.1 ribosomal protein S18-alanine N-acetyltransferase [Nitrospira sp.]